jgi:hypothetical protein
MKINNNLPFQDLYECLHAKRGTVMLVEYAMKNAPKNLDEIDQCVPCKTYISDCHFEGFKARVIF